ncbi:hypothetical protein ACR2R6_23290 (plasmid) [Methylocaldum gracile subsp. desertum]|uniref:hypothetical protein n=1 Tax=Methylocaldum sp. GT1BW TaxID=3438964 RepID=UPI003DA01D4C
MRQTIKETTLRELVEANSVRSACVVGLRAARPDRAEALRKTRTKLKQTGLL